MLDFEIQRCTRKCAATGRAFEPGEAFYSVLQPRDGQVERLDYGEDAWEGPPENAVGWWKSAMPGRHTNRLSWAPNDVMLDLFLRWADDPDRREIRYVLALLLVRRRVMRLEETVPHDDDEHHGGEELLAVYCPRRDEAYQVPVAIPDPDHAVAIQDELAQLLLARAA